MRGNTELYASFRSLLVYCLYWMDDWILWQSLFQWAFEIESPKISWKSEKRWMSGQTLWPDSLRSSPRHRPHHMAGWSVEACLLRNRSQNILSLSVGRGDTEQPACPDKKQTCTICPVHALCGAIRIKVVSSDYFIEWCFHRLYPHWVLENSLIQTFNRTKQL